MSEIEEAIKSKVLADSAVAALVVDRMTVNELPQKTAYPAIVYEVGDKERDQTMEGPSGVVTALFDVTVYDDNYSGVKTLAKAVRQALDIGRTIVLGVTILGVFLESENDIFDEDLEVNSSIMNFSVMYQEEV